MAVEPYRDPKRVLAGRQVALRMLEDAVKQEIAATRSHLEPMLAPQERVVAQLPDGTAIGTVGRSKVSQYAKVTDEAALLAWVEKNRPDELVKSVRESTLEAWKKQCKADGHAHTPDGEVIPGIEVVTGNGSFRPTPDDEYRHDVLSALFGAMQGNGVLAELPDSSEGAA